MMSLTYFILVLTLLFHAGNCLNCYNCMSKGSKACLDPASHPELKPQPCNMEQINQLADQARNIAQTLGNALGIDIPPSQKEVVPLVCQKVVTSVGNEEVIIRSCSVPSQQDASYCTNMNKVANQVITHCSLCDTDGCNSANGLAPLSLLSLMFATITISIWTIFTS